MACGSSDENGVMVWEETLAWGNSEKVLTEPHFLNASLATARKHTTCLYAAACLSAVHKQSVVSERLPVITLQTRCSTAM